MWGQVYPVSRLADGRLNKSKNAAATRRPSDLILELLAFSMPRLGARSELWRIAYCADISVYWIVRGECEAPLLPSYSVVFKKDPDGDITALNSLKPCRN